MIIFGVRMKTKMKTKMETNADRRIERVSAETPYWLQAAAVPGLTVALLEDGQTRDVLCFGVTRPGGKEPVTEETIFKAASLSKQAFLYAALKTVEAGMLDVERPLSQYMDRPFDANDADLERITARHVLTHTTGWHNFPADGELMTRKAPLGQQWTYSGQAFLYLQAALESLWNQPAANYLQRLVLDPLGMPKSSFVWRDEYAETAVEGFDQHGDIPDICRWYPTEADASGSLHTTAREYARLLEAYLGADLCLRHPDVYCRQVEIDKRLGWSLGWGTASDVLWQWGYHVGFNAFAALVPSRGTGIVILTNGAKGQRINREWVNAWLGTDLPAFYLKGIVL